MGIDLGTTNSCMGIWNFETETVEILPNKLGKNTTPSWIGFNEAGKIFVGERAKNQTTFIFDAKRMIGKAFSDEDVQAHKQKWDFVVVGDDQDRCKVEVPGMEAQSIEQISACVLQALKEAASERLGREVKKAVVTVPAYFNAAQKQATQDAARIAGLDILRIINEPTAAAMAAGIHEEDDEKNILIFDFGGGTFDISVLTISEGVIDVQATRGDMNLGGRDLDEVLVEHCLEEFKKTTGTDLTSDKRARTRLNTECEKAKINLSVAYETKIKVHAFHNDQDLEVTVTREQFEELGAEVFEKLIQPVEDALADACMSVDEIDDILLVGGSTRIPKVRSWLQEYFEDKPPNDALNPDEAVAHGATIMAGVLAPAAGSSAPAEPAQPQPHMNGGGGAAVPQQTDA